MPHAAASGRFPSEPVAQINPSAFLAGNPVNFPHLAGVGPLYEKPVFRPRFCFRVGIRALLTNGYIALMWIASGLPSNRKSSPASTTVAVTKRMLSGQSGLPAE